MSPPCRLEVREPDEPGQPAVWTVTNKAGEQLVVLKTAQPVPEAQGVAFEFGTQRAARSRKARGLPKSFPEFLQQFRDGLSIDLREQGSASQDLRSDLQKAQGECEKELAAQTALKASIASEI